MKDRSKVTWSFSQPGGERGETDEWIDMTEEEILADHYDFWKGRMIKKYGPDSELITEDNCIQDWATDNYAFKND